MRHFSNLRKEINTKNASDCHQYLCSVGCCLAIVIIILQRTELLLQLEYRLYFDKSVKGLSVAPRDVSWCSR